MSIEEFSPKQMYYGYPIFLVGTLDQALGQRDLTPLTSSFILKDRMVIGLLHGSKCHENILNGSDVTINIPSPHLWSAIQKMSKYSGQPDYLGKIHTDDKISLAGLTGIPSKHVKPPRIKECNIQIEAKVKRVIDSDFLSFVELDCVAYYANSELLTEEKQIDPDKWEPLIMKFNQICTTSSPIGYHDKYAKKD